VLNLGAAGATLAPGLDPYAHAEMVLGESDWLGVLFGDHTGLAPALAGRFHPSRDTANRALLLGIVMFIFAHVPAGANPDPELLVRIIGGALGNGLPACEGEPATLEALDDFLNDPEGEIGALVLPPAGAASVTRVLAQILEWEDWTFLAHSGASIVPVALAAGEQAEASGRDVLTAIVAANEILARAGGVLTDAVNTGNALAVHQIETTLVAGKLLGLSAEELQDALGIACTQPQMTSIISWTAEAKGRPTGCPP